MSLFRIPGASSVAPSRLSASEPIVAPATHGGERRPRHEPGRDGDPREKTGAADAGDGALERHRARGSGRHAPKGRHEPGASSPRLADLAGDGVAPARGQRRDEGQHGQIAFERDDRQQRGSRRETCIGDRVPGAAASASFLGDAEERLATQAQPRADRCREERREEQPPARPTGRNCDRGADDGAGYAARHGHRASAIAQPRDGDVRDRGWDDGLTTGSERRSDEILANERQRPEDCRRRRRNRNIVVKPDGDRLDERGDERRDEGRHDREPQLRSRRHIRPAPPGE